MCGDTFIRRVGELYLQRTDFSQWSSSRITHFTQILLKFTQILPKSHINPFNRVRTFSHSRQKRADLGRYVFRLHNPCKIAPKNMCYSKLLKFTQIYSNSPTERPQAAQHTQTWSSLEPRTVLDIMCVFQHKTETKFRHLSDDT